MAKKTGTCMNLDCDNYKKEVEVEPGGEFECPLCHQPLKESKGKKSSTPNPGKKKVMMIVGGLVVVAAAAVGITMSGDSKSETPVSDPPQIGIAKVDSAVVDTPAVAVTPEVTPKKEANKPGATTHIQNGKGTVNLGYGSYTGDLKNGKPHGYGTITYQTSCKIVPSKDFIANPGDTFEGEFRDGKISGLGYWEHNGNKTAVKP